MSVYGVLCICCNPVALFVGVLATLHKSTIHFPKSFTGRKIKAEASRKNECLV